ncbi:MAG: hypothetical protein M1830_007067, partial [Pleopsidium flavum]
SGHNGGVGSTGLSLHPFHNAPVAKTVRQETNHARQPEMREPRSERRRRHVTFTPSAMGGEDDNPNAGPSTTELYHRVLSSEPVPLARESSTPRVPTSAGGQARTWQEVADKSKWEEFCEVMCVVCCGVERQAAGEMAAPVLSSGVVRSAGRYADSGYGRYAA